MILRSINEGLKFAFSLKIILPYMALYLISFYILIGFFPNVINVISAGTGIYRLLFSLGIFLPILIIIGLIYLWIHGTVIDQARYYPKRKPLIKSFEYSTSRYLTMFCTLILFVIINGIISSPPYIGLFLSFILGLVLFFLFQAVIVDKKGCIESFKKSFNTFIRYPLETFVTWLLVLIISFIIVGIFASPLMFFVLGKLVSMPKLPTPVGVEPQTIIGNLLPAISDAVSSPYFIIYLLIVCFGLAYTDAFQIGTKTRLYINTRKIEI